MTFLVLVYTYKGFAQTLQNFARSHDCTTVTFKSSDHSLLQNFLIKITLHSSLQERPVVLGVLARENW